jgi:Beta-propeller repeat/PASTA domain
MQSRRSTPALILVLIAFTVSSASGTTRVKQARDTLGNSAARQAALSAYRGVPLAFAPNAGHFDRRVLYAARGRNASTFLTRTGAVVALAKRTRGMALRLAFLGASPDAQIAGARRSPGRVNYLVGDDPSRWRRNLPTYAEVVYHDLWPGIDLAVRGRAGELTYEFRLAPGADPARIRLAYRGQERLSLGRDGALRIETPLGLLRDTRPVSYQHVGGRLVAVESSFALRHGGAYNFALGAYDSRRPLVIDPGLVYSTFLGGSGANDSGRAIAVDGAGSAYVTGSTGSTTFPTTPGAFDTRFNGARSDTFVTKLNAAGSALVYSTYVGGSAIDRGWGIAVDRDGSAYWTGATQSSNFPITAGAFDTSFNGGPRGQEFDAFAAKLSPDGSALTYSTYLGGDGVDRGAGIALGNAGTAYVTGFTHSTDFPTTAGAFDTDLNGIQDAFVTKLNAAGSALAYSTHLGGSRPDGDWRYGGIAVDGAGSAYVTGSTTSSDFPTTPGAYDTTFGGSEWPDAYVTKLNAAGSALEYSTYLGGEGTPDASNGIAVDGAGSAYVAGYTGSRDFPTTPGAFDTSFEGGDAFVTKLNAAGSALVYSTFLDHARGYGIAVDSAGRAYVTGDASKGFPTTPGAADASAKGSYGDAFVTKLNETGSALAYSTFLGGNTYEDGSGIAIDGSDNAYVTGYTESPSFPTTARAFDRTYNGRGAGNGDGFVSKLDLIAGPPDLVRCRVPRVIGTKLPKAKRTIKARHCSVGRVRRVRSKRVGRVVAQSPRAGAVRKRGFKVNLAVGRR